MWYKFIPDGIGAENYSILQKGDGRIFHFNKNQRQNQTNLTANVNIIKK